LRTSAVGTRLIDMLNLVKTYRCRAPWEGLLQDVTFFTCRFQQRIGRERKREQIVLELMEKYEDRGSRVLEP
jgi:hypothetical protein